MPLCTSTGSNIRHSFSSRPCKSHTGCISRCSNSNGTRNMCNICNNGNSGSLWTCLALALARGPTLQAAAACLQTVHQLRADRAGAAREWVLQAS